MSPETANAGRLVISASVVCSLHLWLSLVSYAARESHRWRGYWPVPDRLPNTPQLLEPGYVRSSEETALVIDVNALQILLVEEACGDDRVTRRHT